MNINETPKSMEIQLHNVLRDQLRNQCRQEEFLIEQIKSVDRIAETTEQERLEIEKISITYQEIRGSTKSIITDINQCSEHIAEIKRSNKQFLQFLKDYHQELRDERNKPPMIISLIQKICMFIFLIIKGIGNSIIGCGNTAFEARPHIFRGPYYWVLPRRYNISH